MSEGPLEDCILGEFLTVSDDSNIVLKFYDGSSSDRHITQENLEGDVEFLPGVTITGDLEKFASDLDLFFQTASETDNLDLTTSTLIYNDDEGKLELEVMPASQRMGFQGLDLAAGVDAMESVQIESPPWDDGPLERYVQLQVRPKIDGTDWEQLLAAANGLDPDDLSGHRYTDTGGAIEFDIARVLAAMYLDALESLFQDYGGLRQRHRRVERDLKAQVRGRMRVSEYVTRISRGEVTTVPCEFSELQLDNRANRTLRWALHLAGRLLQASPSPTDGDDLAMQLRSLDRRFAEVERTPITTDEVPDPESLPTAFSGYEDSDALRVARQLIENVDIGLDPGTKIKTLGFSFQMYDIFETAFANLLANEWDLPADRIGQVTETFSVDNTNNRDDHALDIAAHDESVGDKSNESDGTIIPDVYIKAEDVSGTQTAAIIADTKWKHSMRDANQDIDRSALYQITTYTHYARRNSTTGAVGFLVYPIIVKSTDYSIEEFTHRINWDGDTTPGDQEGQICVIGWPVGCADTDADFNLRKSAQHVSEQLRKIVDCD